MNPILIGIILAGGYDKLFDADWRGKEKKLFGFNYGEFVTVDSLQAVGTDFWGNSL